jgi:hypothetical protein
MILFRVGMHLEVLDFKAVVVTHSLVHHLGVVGRRRKAFLRRRSSTAALAETLSPAPTTNPKPALFRYTLGSDWDGSTTVMFDASELAALTQALLVEGLTPAAIQKVMGENLLEFLATHLPVTEEARLTFADERNDNVQSLR